MKKILQYITVLSILLFTMYSQAQTDTEFWFVNPEISTNHGDDPVIFVFTTRDFAAEVTIEMPAEPAFTPVTLNIPAYTTDFLPIAQVDPEFALIENTTVIDELSLPVGSRDNIGNKAILITSTAPINVYFTQDRQNNSDIYALKGANGIGTEFIIPFQEHAYNQADGYLYRAFSSVEIISFEDGTQVEITPPAGRDVYRSGTFPNEINPFTVTIDRGEVYTLPPGWDPTVDRQNPFTGWWRVEGFERISGVIIKVVSGPGVAVVKKDDSARRGLDVGASSGGWDIIADQWVPYKGVAGEDNDILGKEYVAMRGQLDNGWEWVYAAAPEDNTRIWWGNSIDTTLGPPNAIIQRGEQVGIQFDNGAFPVGPFDFMEIISNKPLSVLHVSGDGTEMGGAVLPPIDKCTGSTSVTIARSENWPVFLNIMARAGAEDDFLFEGAVRNDLIDPTNFWPVGTTGDWVATQVTIPQDDFSDFPVGIARTISNTEDVFHLGVIHGGGPGCRFGYFSDFNELRVSANTIQGDGIQPSSTIRACKGDTVQLYASGGSVFNWWPSTNLSSTTVSNPKAVVDAFRTYFVEVSGACNNKDTATVTIEMAEQPDAVFFMEKGEGCAPLELEMRNLSTDVNQIYWDFNTTNIGGVIDRDTTKYHPSIITDVDSIFTHTFFNTSFEPVDSPETYHIQLKVKATKCIDTINTTLTVYPEVTADFTLSDLNDTLSCNPAVVDFQSSALSINEDFYKWNFGDGALSAAGDTVHEYVNFDPENDTTYTARLVARSQWFCRDTAYQDFTIHPYLEGGFTIDKDEGCSPFNVTIENTSSGADSIFLDYGDGTIDTLLTFSSITHLYENNDGVDEVDTNIIVIRVKNDEGCEFIDSDTVLVYPEFEANYLIDGPGDYEGCNSRTVTFTNTTNDGTHVASRYLWEFDDGTSMDTTNNAIQKLYNNTTSANREYDFRLTARSQYGCTDDTTNTITIYRAEANFTVDNNEGCSPLGVRVTNISIGDEVDTWNWDYGDGVGSSAIEQPLGQYTYNNIGIENDTNYLVLEVSEPVGGCTTTDTAMIVVYPEVQVSYVENQIHVPACDSLVVEFNSTLASALLVTYEWDFGDGGSSSAADTVHVYKNLLLSNTVDRFVTLRAESDMGCFDEASSTITVYPRVRAKISVDKTEGCSQLTINTNAQTYPGNDIYQWTYGDGYNPVMIDPPSHTYPANPPGSNDVYTLTLDVEDATGTCADTDTKTITVFDEAKADFDPKDSTDCNPFEVTFDNLSLNAVSYKWDFDDGGTTSTDFEPTYEFVNTTSGPIIFGVELEATSDEGCTDIITSNVNVLPYVVADFDVDVSEGCSPLTVTIDNNSAGGTYRWYWDSADGSGVADYTSANSNEIFNHTYTNTSGGDQTVYLTLIAENASGCTDTSTVPITVYSEAKADYSPQGSFGCNPYTVTFDNLSFNAATYQWDFNDGVTSNAFEPTHSFTNMTSSNKPFNVKLEVTSNRGCKHDTTATVNVYSYVNANFDISVSEGCSPLTVEISNNSAGGNYRWFWDSADGSGAADDNSANSSEVFPHTYSNSSGATEVKDLMLIADNGSGCYDTLIRSITVYSSINAGYSYTQNDACAPSDVVFTNTSTGSGTYTMNWNFGDGGTLTTTANTVNKQFINNTTYEKTFNVVMTAESDNGCTDTYSDNIIVHSKVVSDFSIANNEGCPPFATSIENTSIGNAANTYQWLIDGVDAGGPTNKSNFDHIYENTDPSIKDYEVKLIATNPHGCTSEHTDIVSVYEYVEAIFKMSTNNGCAPLLVEFEDSSIVPAETKYTWTFGDGATSGLSDPNHTFYNSSRKDDLNRTINLTVQSANYCSDDTSLSVDIYHQPLAKFYINNTSSCPPLEATLTKLSEGEDSFEWRFGDGTTNTTDVDLAYSWDNTDIDNVQKYNMELWVGTVNNCVDSSNLDLSVFPKVTADFNMDQTGGCSPLEDVQFSNASTLPATQFFWSFGDGTTTNQEDPSHDFTNITSEDRIYDIYFRASSEYDCWDTITKQVEVFVQPEAEFYVTPVLLTYPDNAISLDNRTNTGPFDYLWKFGNIDESTSTSEEPNSYEYGHWGEKIIELEVSSQTNPDCIDSYSDTILIQPPEVNADFTTNIDGGCWGGGLEVEFTAASSAYAEEYAYEWDFGDGTTGTGQNTTHVFESVGTYNVQLTATSTEGAGRDYEYKKIYVYANPEVSFEVSPKLAMLDPSTLKARVKFYNTSLCNDTAGCAYTWEFGDGNTAISKDYTHAYEELGIYDITLTAESANGCRDSLTLYEEVEIIGAGEIAFPNAFTPDGIGPTENETFKPLAEGVIKYELFIYNRWGELIFTTKDLGVGWDGTIDGEPAKPDVYVWKASGEFTNGKSFELAGDVTLIR